MSFDNYPKADWNIASQIVEDKSNASKQMQVVQLKYKSSLCNPEKISVYNISGNLLIKKQFSEKIDLDDSYPKGVYVIVIEFFNNSIVRRVFKSLTYLSVLLVQELVDYSEIDHKGTLLFKKMEPDKAVLWLIKGYNMVNLSLIESIDIGSKASISKIYLVTKLNSDGNKAIITIPENLYQLLSQSWEVLLHLIAHECVHVIQRLKPPKLYSAYSYHNLREFLAYYWNVFQDDYCMSNIPKLNEEKRNEFAKKAKEYYKKLNFMEANSFKSKYDNLIKEFP